MNKDQQNEIMLKALVDISKMGRVCEEFEVCDHIACEDSAAACLTALDALSEIKEEETK